MAVRPVIMCGLETGTLIKIQGYEELGGGKHYDFHWE